MGDRPFKGAKDLKEATDFIQNWKKFKKLKVSVGGSLTKHGFAKENSKQKEINALANAVLAEITWESSVIEDEVFFFEFMGTSQMEEPPSQAETTIIVENLDVVDKKRISSDTLTDSPIK